MANSDCDRNLLFGILALHNGFISRDALIRAMSTWVTDKETPLGQILVRQCDLTPDHHFLMEALVKAHLKQHNDDPEHSLAASNTTALVKALVDRFDDPDIVASVAPTPRSMDDGSTLPGVAGAVGDPTSVGRRFQIIRDHKEGGLGKVFLARDQELNREVALKQIKEQFCTDRDSQARFVAEAEITGGLEHPGVVPVYGLGSDEKHRPYYAMRFIKGESLKEAIDLFHNAGSTDHDPGARSLELRKLLGRFVDVCEAIAYAHSRGVVHRDIKPANIMLGKFGETLVVDWGLAKVVGRDDIAAKVNPGEMTLRPSADIGGQHTLPGSALGTPAYMSPEQAAGELDRVGLASDIYSLGATLYTILTGRPPVQQNDVQAVLWAVRYGEFPPPRSVRHDVDRLLEAVCLKAMARHPDERYPSAQVLAGDIEHWLADEPVTAYAEPLTVRTRRWMRRHRTLVTSGAAVLVFGLAVLTGFAAVLAGKNRELDAKNVAMANKNGQLDAKNVELADKNQELDKQRRRAEERETLAIDAVKKFRDAVQANPELKNRPELDALRKALLKEPMEFFQKLRDQLQADRDTRPEALAKLASANFDLAKTTAEILSIPDALRSYSESLAIRERLTRENPTITAYQTDLAWSHNNIGLLLFNTSRSAEALESHRRALAIRERLAVENPSSIDFRSALSDSINYIGIVLANTGRPTEAMVWFRRAAEIRERLVRERPLGPQFQRDLARSHYNIGILLSDIDRPDEALKSYRRALEIQERLARDHPTDTEYQNSLASSHNNIGLLLSDTGRSIDAMESFQHALKIKEQLVRDNPTVTQYQNSLAISHANVGYLLASTGNPNEALKWHRRALEICERLAHEHPAVTEYQQILAGSHSNIGSLLGKTGQPAEAMESNRRALAIRERLAHDNPLSPVYQSEIGVSLYNIAVIDMVQRRWQEARVRLERAIEHQRKALATVPRQPDYQRHLRSHLLKLAKVYQALNQPAKAIRAARDLPMLSQENADDFYDSACLLALSVPLLQGDQRQALEAEAVQTLRRAIAAGRNKAQHTSRDPDLAPLRNRVDFRRLLAEMFDNGFPTDPFTR